MDKDIEGIEVSKVACLSEEDRENLSQIKEAQTSAAAAAEIALLKSENVDLKYRLYVHELFRKYDLGKEDQILEDGSFKLGVKE